MKKTFLLTLLSILAFILNGQVNVTLHMEEKLGDQYFAYNLTSEAEMGYSFNVSRLQYYVSEIKLIHDGGQVTPVTDLYLLIDAGVQSSFPLGNFSITDLEKIEFSIGVDSAHNHLDPALYPQDHPLALQDPSMHWGWFSGYRFIALEGKAGLDEGSMVNNYQIHTIADANYRTILLDVNEVVSGDNMTIPIQADYNQLFNDVDVSGGMIAHGGNGASKQIADNTRDFVFTASALTSIDKSDVLGTFKISPNPSDGFLHIQYDLENAGNLELAVTDLDGRVVYKTQLDPLQKLFTFKANLPAGFYVTSLFNNNNLIATQKIVMK